MAGDDEAGLFPNMAQKLNAPKKMSEMERNRRAAEEKQRREEALHAETLREFEESFGVASDERDSGPGRFDPSGYPPRGPPGPRGPNFGPGGYAGFQSGPRRSGPGALDSFDAPPMSIQERKRRRAMEEDAAALKREFDGVHEESRSKSGTSLGRHDRESNTAPKNSVRLAGLPPNITEQKIKSLLRDHLKIYSVDIVEQPNPLNIGRRAMTAVVILAAGTTTTDIEKAVSALKDKYLGCGYFLSLSRYLPSDVLYPGMPDESYAPAEYPFGAHPARPEHASSGSMSRAPPPSEFTPPGSYGSGVPTFNQDHPATEALVQVRIPNDMQVLQLIHLMVSWYHSQENMNLALEKECQFMAIPQVQNDPHYAFLYDASSDAGVYFRWLLWNPDGLDVLRGSKRTKKAPVRLYEDVPIDWVPPEMHMPYSDVIEISQILKHLDFDSDEEADDDLPGYRDDNPIPGDGSMLGPLRRARLSHMLAHLPLSRNYLERRHMIPIQTFAMNHAGRGAFEIVDIIQASINRPFNASGFSIAVAPKAESDDEDMDDENVTPAQGNGLEGEHLASADSLTHGQDDTEHEGNQHITALTYDPSTRKPAPPDLLADAKIVMLDVVTAVCIASYHAATPGSHRYRKLFPEAFIGARVIKDLAQTPIDFGWGMIKTDRWEKRVKAVFKTWEEHNCFATDEIQTFRRIYDSTSNKHKMEQEEKNGTQSAVTNIPSTVRPVFQNVEEVAAEQNASAVTDNDDDSSDDDADEEEPDDPEIDGSAINMDRLRAVAASGDANELHLSRGDGTLEAVFRLHENAQPEEDNSQVDEVPQPVSQDTTPAEPPSKPDPAETAPPKKDIDMFADDSD